ncbi:MAG: hypothetical protein KUL79_15355 [Thauera sp.]|nr:hypothetical protein [Thauera sp.]
MIAERRVRHLGIRAPDAAGARRAGLLIEDALRTASLPGDGGELLLVRRLRLPAFGARASPQRVALGLEAACRATVPVAGGGSDDALLARATAVRFADALEAHLALTTHLLGARPARAWCWALAVPGYRPDEGVRAGLRRIALSLARREEAPVALACWWDALLAAGAAPRLLLALDEHDAGLLAARVLALRGRPPPCGADADARRKLLQWVRTTFPPADPRRQLAEALTRDAEAEPAAPPPEDITGTAGSAAAPGHRGRHPAAEPGAGPQARKPSRPQDAEPPSISSDRDGGRGTPVREAGTQADPAPEPSSPRHRRTPPAGTKRPAAARSGESDGGPANVRDIPPAAVAKAGAAAQACRRAVAPTDAAPTRRAPHAPRAEAGVRPHVHAHALSRPTAAGGLLFVLAVLERLGLPKWLDARPRHAATLPAHLLGLLLRRLQLAEDDPAWRLGTPPPPGEPTAAAAAWLAACRRHLRLQAGIGPASLCLRPAQLDLTPTHADVWLGMEQIDLRVRRAGLDLDPGWVPWFGRVVRFHYGPRPR